MASEESKWDIVQLLDSKLVDAIDQLLKNQEPDLAPQITSADRSNPRALITAFVTILNDDNQPPDRRAAAARMLGESARLSRNYCGRKVAPEAGESLTHLINALQYPDLQLSIVNALQSFAPEASSVVIPALLASNADVLVSALQVLRHCNVEVVAGKHDALVNLLQHDDESVRREAYITIGWLGGLASPYLPELAERLRQEQDGSVLHELASALALIDVDGDFLVHHVRCTAAVQTRNLQSGNPRSGEAPRQSSETASREMSQDKLLRLLREIGDTGAPLWRVLNNAWNSPTPPPGYQRMNIDQITGYICSVGKRVDPQTIKNWIATRQLTAIHQPGNLYDVQISDLERLRAANSNPPSPSPPPTSPSVQ